MRNSTRRLALFSSAMLLAACSQQGTQAPVPANAGLKDIFKDAFRVGTALSPRQFNETDTASIALIDKHFNITTPENVLKWEVVHPTRGTFSYVQSDGYVAFGERHHMFITGHTLVWHSQTPRWVFEDTLGKPLTRAALLAVMKNHIENVVGRYKGRINGWDVVNEALNEDGTMRQSPWMRIIGDDFPIKAFEYAHAVDPQAELYYNDYNLETPAKRDGAIALVKRIRAAGIPVTAIGSQDHHKMDWPSAALTDSMFTAFRAANIHGNVTELDIDVLPRATNNNTADVAVRAQMQARLNPYAAGLPDSVQTALARRYGEIFKVYWKHRDIIDRITFWGVTDRDSWLNGWPVPGRTNYPLLFDRNGKPKPAYDAVVAVAGSSAR
ncbi:MAG: glycoside hydrolase family 10 [Gemmatimonadetes bacterium]|nr:glycoside hydrolase family 10 [Gemmatimonadota bacterium]